ncbi:MAG TPA: hypothetical protein VGO83_12970 [Thermoleophilaceae bacterium]|nr:hypothetical protein [Thermoleophilaceae bacterium]
MLAALPVLAGCGGDDEQTTATAANTTPTETAPAVTAPADTATEKDDAPKGEDLVTETSPSPEDQPGGAGDEEPARTLALFTARGGQIRPRVVRVPAFISIQVELRSADGARYGLRFGDTTITAGGDLNSVSTTIDGLRPGEAITGRPTGAGNRVRISATAEPGP